MGGESALVTALRGFKIRTSTLDKFLIAHGQPHGVEAGCVPPLYRFDDNGKATDEVSEAIRAHMESVSGTGSGSLAGVLFVVPSVEGHSRSSWAYVAYSHVHVYAHRRITPQDPPDEIPKGFEQLRQDVLWYSSSSEEYEGLMGFFIVSSRERSGPTPVELRERWQVQPIPCGLCEQTFPRWSARQWHRNEVHGMDEELNALPANA